MGTGPSDRQLYSANITIRVDPQPLLTQCDGLLLTFHCHAQGVVRRQTVAAENLCRLLILIAPAQQRSAPCAVDG
jgi:hypothetical protein